MTPTGNCKCRRMLMFLVRRNGMDVRHDDRPPHANAGPQLSPKGARLYIVWYLATLVCYMRGCMITRRTGADPEYVGTRAVLWRLCQSHYIRQKGLYLIFGTDARSRRPSPAIVALPSSMTEPPLTSTAVHTGSFRKTAPAVLNTLSMSGRRSAPHGTAGGHRPRACPRRC